MSFSSDDINYLIYRYLHESGFEHSAFTFASESRVLESGIAGSDIPMGALINVVQKGIFYTEAELCSIASTSAAGDVRADKPVMDNLTLLEAVLNDSPTNKEREKSATDIAKSPKAVAAVNNNNDKHLQQMRDREMREAHQEKRNISAGTSKDSESISTGSSFATPIVSASPSNAPSFSGTTNLSNSPAASSAANSHHSFPPTVNQSYKQHQVFTGSGQSKVERDRECRDRVVNNGQVGKFKIAADYRAAHANGNINGTPMELDGVPVGHMKNGNGTYSSNPVQIGTKGFEISKDKIRRLEGHTGEVFVCSWNPVNDLIATGSGDSTVRIWNTTRSELQPSSQAVVKCVHTLQHTFAANENSCMKDVTSIDWNNSGDLLVTGCYDGRARIWKPSGELICILTAHKGPIFALKWSAKGDKILSAGVDKTTIVWNAANGTELQRFQLHSSSALDIDWISDDTFASCSTDKQIFVCKLGCDKAIMTYSGHTNEINAVKYDAHSKLLASCSDDMTLKIWSLHSDHCLFNFNSHEKEVYTIRWSPLGYIVASASLDHTVRLWDAKDGKCLQTLVKHTEPVYTVGFSPDGTYIASGSFDKSVCIWDVKTGSVVQSYSGNQNDGGIFEVGWNCRGDKVAASTHGGTVIILDVRHLKRSL
uniref:LisH domain-containing protein n=1 Tax=Syphacia muris TaxID=451379 RepID=A0A0N5AV02_9BILA